MKKRPRPSAEALEALALAQNEKVVQALEALLQPLPPDGPWVPAARSASEQSARRRADEAEFKVARFIDYFNALHQGQSLQEVLKEARAAQQTHNATKVRIEKAADALAEQQRAANVVLSLALFALDKSEVPERNYHPLLYKLWPTSAGKKPARDRRQQLREKFTQIPLDEETRSRVRAIAGPRAKPADLVTKDAQAELAPIVERLLAR